MIDPFSSGCRSASSALAWNSPASARNQKVTLVIQSTMSTSTPRRAALYLRQSLDRAEGIDAQRKRCTDLASARGWPIVAVFDDNEVRASSARGEGTRWHEMLGRVGREFEVIIAVDLDRLVRSTSDLNKLIERGAQVVTVDGEIDLTSADGEFRATMIAGIARFETRRASERQRRHKAAKAERGEWHGGIPPYGYRAEAGRLVPEPVEVKRIHEVAQRLLDFREPMHAIVTDWNNQGVKTRGGNHWRQANLRSIMLNRSMLGETKAGKVGWEPIIDPETFDRVTRLLTDPSRKVVHSPGVKGGKYSMGGGLTVCAKCGKPLITATKSGGGSGKRPAIGCLARVHGPDPKNHPRVERVTTRNGEKITVMQDTGRVNIDHDLLEGYVFEQAIARLNDSEYWQKRKAERDPDAQSKIAALNAKREALFEKRARAEDLALDGLITKERLRSEIQSVEAEVEQIGKDIQALVGAPDIEQAFGPRDAILARWTEWTPGQRREFLRLLIARVVVDEWPEGMPRTRPQLRNESDEDYSNARAAILRQAVEARVTIDWA
ncbi:recombinase family protein [Microbacterium sp. CFH 31415]|uniref:recombinase family protein n=1 Tax=Microbacterium sp. CFH 31415 TaxID=2921732 RepID=UPI001F13377B|nr:recombinase family protein [Microbacterium sp. CFH 31415]MCH6229346.1 recombinase family protein [Microbacterium sp. CFH 31415]